MKICILTQPLHTNYGGLLQAYALQTVLKRMGHEVWTEDRRPNKPTVSQKLKKLIRSFLEKIPIQKRFRKLFVLSESQQALIRRNTDYFIQKYIQTTEPIFSTKKPEFEMYNFDAYIVGSDQVWRPCYSEGLENYFLDFTSGKNVKRIAYAASFGVDDWEFTNQQTKKCAHLANKFDAISVREDSGIYLCNTYLGVNAVHVLDPTLLLNADDYIRIVDLENEPKRPGNLFCYILDESKEKSNVIQYIVKDTGFLPFNSKQKLSLTQENVQKNINDCIFPSVTQWLRSFIDAEMVVTDSFHGCVFSIIFNKPFWALINKGRGEARFYSLLKVFHLEDRLISLDSVEDKQWKKPIDWNDVNKICNQMKKKSIEFLAGHLY